MAPKWFLCCTSALTILAGATGASAQDGSWWGVRAGANGSALIGPAEAGENFEPGVHIGLLLSDRTREHLSIEGEAFYERASSSIPAADESYDFDLIGVGLKLRFLPFGNPGFNLQLGARGAWDLANNSEGIRRFHRGIVFGLGYDLDDVWGIEIDSLVTSQPSVETTYVINRETGAVAELGEFHLDTFNVTLRYMFWEIL